MAEKNYVYKATYKRRMSKKKKKLRAIRRLITLIALLLVLAVIVVAAVILFKKSDDQGATTDLQSYYNLSADASSERVAAGSDELAIVQNGEILEERALKFNNQIYISQNLMKRSVDSRFYYDSNEQVMLFANAEDIYTIHPDESDYLVNEDTQNAGYAPAIMYNEKLYIALDFADDLTFVPWKEYSEPARIVISNATGSKDYVDTKKKTVIRVLGGPKSDIVARIDKGTKLQVLEDLDDWYGVVSEDGWKGYVDAKAVGKTYSEVTADTHIEPEYTKLTFDGTIKLGWGGVYMEGGNALYEDMVEYAGSNMNVFAPTWYYLENNDYNLTIYSEQDYVDIAHNDGYDVWALLADSNVDYDFVEYVLTHTSERHALIDRIMNDMEEKGIDGLNLDLERVMSEYGDDFIQLVREFSIACRKAGKFFTVDNYAPYEYNACYHIEEQSRICDYVMLMAYDDYLGTGEAGPNSSLPFIGEVTELTIGKVDSSRLVVGLPFYSRLWYQTGDSLVKEEYNMTRARNIVEEGGGELTWNSALGLDEAQYTDDEGDEVYAWLESRASYEAKLNLLKNYDIAGIAFWTLGQEDEDVWEVISTY